MVIISSYKTNLKKPRALSENDEEDDNKHANEANSPSFTLMNPGLLMCEGQLNDSMAVKDGKCYGEGDTVKQQP